MRCGEGYVEMDIKMCRRICRDRYWDRYRYMKNSNILCYLNNDKRIDIDTDIEIDIETNTNLI